LSGNITTIEDANHHLTQYDYDPTFRTVTRKDALNNLTIATYDNLGRIQQLNQLGALPTLNRTTSYDYDLTTNTTTVTRPEGIVEITHSDSVGNVTEIQTTVKGIIHLTKYEHDGLKHLTKITDADSNTQTFNYDNLGNLTLTTKTDFSTNIAHTTELKSNNLGWKTQTKNAEGQVFKNTYDAVGNIITQTENGLRETRSNYDNINRQIGVTTTYGADTLHTFTGYDAVGNITSATDAQGNITNYKYDELNRQTKIIDAKHQTTEIAYDPVGNILAVITNPLVNPRQIKYKYDKLDRQTDVTDAEGIVTHAEYNEFDITSIIENFNVNGTNTRTTQFEYDKLGRKIKTIDAANHPPTQTKYDEAGNITWVKDGNGNRTSYNYDKLNRRVEIIDANNILTQSTKYDGFGNVKSVKDSGHNETKYDYDLINRQTKMTDPHGKSVIYHYDGLSRVDEITDRNHRTRNFSYDINDNLLTEAWSNGVRLTYTYDKVSNLLASTDSSSNTINSYGYDEIYQLTDKTTGNTKFHYDYDVYGDLTQRQDWVNNSQIATIDYTYDKNHQLTYLHQTGTGVVATDIGFSYDRLNQLTKINRSDANDLGHLVTDYQYDAVGLVADINSYFNTTANTVSHYHYGYDAGNRLILTTGTDGNSAVNYGNDNQLTGVTKSSGANESYNFDALGIRSGWSTVAGDSRQVLSDGTYEYRYDDEGNLSRKKELSTGAITNYSWDYRNRLTSVTSGSQTVEYGYDAEDKRVSKKINGVVTEKYIYDGTDIALVLDGAGTLLERYLFGAGVDNVLSRESGGAVVWSLGDKQGSVVDLVDEHGVVLNHFVYDGFGNRTGSTGAEFRFGYTGRELDSETGLYYYRARYYDPGVGRFISEDPIGFAAGDTNLYRYVNNSPTNYTDPSGQIIPFILAGLAAWSEVALAAGAIGAAAGAVYGFGTEAIGSLAKDYDSGHLSFDSIGRAVGHGVEGAAHGAVFGFALGVTSTIPVVGNLAVGGFLAYGSITGAQRSAEAFQQGHNATGIFELTNAFLGAKFAGKHLGQGVADVQGAWINRESKSHVGFSGEGYVGTPDPDAVKKYQGIMKYDDISLIAEQTGFSEEILAQAKQHLFMKEHNIPIADPTSSSGNKVVNAKFEPDLGIATSWIAARTGFSKPGALITEKPHFSRLVVHEYIESKLMEAGIPFISTHSSAWKTGDYRSSPQHFGAHDLSIGHNNFSHYENRLGLSSEGLIMPENSSTLTKQHADNIVNSILERVKDHNFE
jgi:RHS repeat-associated protein